MMHRRFNLRPAHPGARRSPVLATKRPGVVADHADPMSPCLRHPCHPRPVRHRPALAHQDLDLPQLGHDLLRLVLLAHHPIPKPTHQSHIIGRLLTGGAGQVRQLNSAAICPWLLNQQRRIRPAKASQPQIALVPGDRLISTTCDRYRMGMLVVTSTGLGPRQPPFVSRP